MLRHPLAAACLLLLAACSARAAAPVAPDPLRDLARLRQVSNPARLEALQALLRERGLPFELQTFPSPATPLGRTTGTNVMLTFGPAEGREIVLSAHYDAVEWKQSGTLSQGMVDNGSGTMILLDVATALRGRPLRHRIRFLWTDQEEFGLKGIEAFLASRKPGEIAAVVNVDTAGYGEAAVYGVGKTAADAQLHQTVATVCAAQRLECLEFPAFPAGDDRAVQRAAIPVVSIGFLPRIEAHQLWLLFNAKEGSGLADGWVPPVLKIIHTPEDTLDKVDPRTLGRGTGLVLETVRRLDAELG
ncbi:MAG TPA: Zn-dependent exopeptidase M28 [Acidobacteria bacterium]|nr:Zn-dependent exopeptidase M28 [Acidobacteriota bacterium]